MGKRNLEAEKHINTHLDSPLRLVSLHAHLPIVQYLESIIENNSNK